MSKAEHRIETTLARLETAAAEFFAEQKAQMDRIELLALRIAQKIDAAPEIEAAVKDLDATTVALQGAVDSANSPPSPAKE